MRKKFFIFAMVVFILSTIFVISCSENFGTTEDQITQIKGNPLSKPSMNFNISQFRMDEINQKALSLDFKVIHDKCGVMICDSVQTWRRKNMLDPTILNNVWEMIINGLSLDLNISRNESIAIANMINMSKENFINFQPKNWKSSLPIVYQNFFNDIHQSVSSNTELSDEQILELLENKRVYWSNIMEPQFVKKTVDIAKSSYIHWINNIDYLFNETQINLRRPDPKKVAAGIGLAEDDLGGALWGGFTGGLAGAVLGAVGATLVGSIKLAIHGY